MPFNATGPVYNKNDLSSVAFHRFNSFKDLSSLANSLGSFPLNESKRDVISFRLVCDNRPLNPLLKCHLK